MHVSLTDKSSSHIQCTVYESTVSTYFNHIYIYSFFIYLVTYINGLVNIKKKKKKKKENKSYKRNLYIVLNFVILLLRTAISRCILIFSLRSVRKLSKQSFFSCREQLYMEYFAIRSV